MVSIDEVEEKLDQLNGANKLYFTAQNEEEKQAANQQFQEAWKWFQEVAGYALELDIERHLWVLANEGPTFYIPYNTGEDTLKELREHNIAFSRQSENIKVVFPPGTRKVPAAQPAGTYNLITRAGWMIREMPWREKGKLYSSLLIPIDQGKEEE